VSFWDWLKELFGEQKQELDSFDLSLADLKKGYLVDYDLKTWQVKSHNAYDFDGDRAEEWELYSGDDRVYLEGEKDDEYEWAISRKIEFSALGKDVGDHLIEQHDPPQEIVHDGTRYTLEESGGGYFFPDGRVAGDEMIYWDYADETGEKLLTIEQWGETEFEASVGQTVKDYEFRNILPKQED
jgi:hypothetical protein